jgi:hypothetical protein
MSDDYGDMVIPFVFLSIIVVILLCAAEPLLWHFVWWKLKYIFYSDRHMLIQVLSWGKLVYISKMFRNMETLST